MNRPISALQKKITLDDLAAVKQPISLARGMPNEAYTDEGFFEFERDHVMSRQWVAMEFIDKIPPSTLKPIDFMGFPLLITSSANGELKVFHNVCSHRGMRLVDKERKSNGLIVCPYHSWTYGLSGELKATPHIGGVDVHTADGFSCKEKGLKPINFHCWLGILFVNIGGNAMPFEQDAAVILNRYRD